MNNEIEAKTVDTSTEKAVFVQKRTNIVSARDITVSAVMTALLITTQLVLSMIAGVELISLLFCSFAVAFGRKRAMMTATAFALLRCFVFGTMFNVILLYLIYYNGIALFFGSECTNKVTKFPYVIIVAVIFTAMFTMLDNIISPIVYGVSFYPYFIASLPVMFTQLINVAITFLVMYLPLTKAFQQICKFTR